MSPNLIALLCLTTEMDRISFDKEDMQLSNFFHFCCGFKSKVENFFTKFFPKKIIKINHASNQHCCHSACANTHLGVQYQHKIFPITE